VGWRGDGATGLRAGDGHRHRAGLRDHWRHRLRGTPRLWRDRTVTNLAARLCGEAAAARSSFRDECKAPSAPPSRPTRSASSRSRDSIARWPRTRSGPARSRNAATA